MAQYLERLPDNLIPKKRELLEEVRQTEEALQAQVPIT